MLSGAAAALVAGAALMATGSTVVIDAAEAAAATTQVNLPQVAAAAARQLQELQHNHKQSDRLSTQHKQQLPSRVMTVCRLWRQQQAVLQMETCASTTCYPWCVESPCVQSA